MAISDNFQGQRPPSIQAFWMGGMDSNRAPLLLAPTNYQCAFNAINRGGNITVRPRHRLVLNVPGSNPQCIIFFTPTDEDYPTLVVVSDGAIYTSLWPYTALSPLPGASLSPSALQVFATVVTKSVKQETSGAEDLIAPVSYLILTDGVSRAVRWDGVRPPVTMDPQPPAFGVPAEAGPGVFSNGRAFFAVGNQVYASDLDDPDTFTETLIVAEGGFIPAPEPVTCLIETPDRSGIIMFTARSAYFIKSSLRDRTQWQTDPTFFTTLLTGLGCAGAKAAINQFGQTWFFSPGGLLNLNTAQQTYQSSRVLYQDLPMKRSKDNLSADCSKVCLATHEDYLLCSVPSGSVHNRHTWCYDQNAGNGPAYASIWTGTSPVEYTTAIIQGKIRTFFLSRDYHPNPIGTRLNVWEAFSDELSEPSGEVVANVQTSLFQVASLEPTSFVQGELFLADVEGSLNVQMWIGRNAGGYLPVLNRNVVSPRGPFTPDWTTPNNASIIDDFRPQRRILRTAYLDNIIAALALPASVISQRQEGGETQAIGIGRTLSLLIQLTGVGSIESIRLTQDNKPTLTDPTCGPDETSLTSQPLLAQDYRTEVAYSSL